MLRLSVGKRVRVHGRPEIFLIVNLDSRAQTVDLAHGTVAIEILRNIPFALVEELEEGRPSNLA